MPLHSKVRTIRSSLVPPSGHPISNSHLSQMDEICIQTGIDKTIDALIAERLALLCGAGLSMAAPSSLPSADQLAARAKQKYDANFGSDREPLPASIKEQARFFFERGELYTVYLRTYVDSNAFSSKPNLGHCAIADLLLVRGISTVVSTNVDMLIEISGSLLNGMIAAGVTRDEVAQTPSEKSPLLKLHGCWSQPQGTIWATEQASEEPIRSRLNDCDQWLRVQLLDRDLLIVGYSTDWNYLNEVLESVIGTVSPTRVIVVDPCESAEFAGKAPMLYELGQRASDEFCHVRCSGHEFLNRLRVEFSRTFVRSVINSGRDAYLDIVGEAPEDHWFEPTSDDPEVLWRTRRDFEGCSPTEPSTMRNAPDESLLGLTVLQLRANGAIPTGSFWEIKDRTIRIVRTPNRFLYDVEKIYSRESPPAIAPDVVIAVGAYDVSLPRSVARASQSHSIVRGPSPIWLSREAAVVELEL